MPDILYHCVIGGGREHRHFKLVGPPDRDEVDREACLRWFQDLVPSFQERNRGGPVEFWYEVVDR